MIERAVTKNYNEIYVISEKDLKGVRQTGAKIRSSCPVHKSNSTNDLSTDAPESGENAGFGHCYSCGARILVKEWNPEAAARLLKTDVKETHSALRQQLAKSKQYHAAEREKEQVLLLKLHPYAVEALQKHKRALQYLEMRGFGTPEALELVRTLQIGYIAPASEWKQPPHKLLEKWCDRIIFPLSKNEQTGFVGRTLQLWTPGMSEEEHRNVLKEAHLWDYRQRKSPIGGWFHAQALVEHRHIILVEGPFDALALLMADFQNVVGLVGASFNVKALPAKVLEVTLAFDNDQEEQALNKRIEALAEAGIHANVVLPPKDDGLGKDWSERYKNAGEYGLSSLFEYAHMKEYNFKMAVHLPAWVKPAQEEAGSEECAADWELEAEIIRLEDEPFRRELEEWLEADITDQEEAGLVESSLAIPEETISVSLPVIEPLQSTAIEIPGITVLTTPSALYQACEAIVSKPGQYGFDIEATGLSPFRNKDGSYQSYIVSVAFGSPDRVYILDTRRYYDLSLEEQEEWRAALQCLASLPGITWTGQNLKYDWKMCYSHFSMKLDRVYDVMLADKVVTGNSEFHYDLKAIAARCQIEVSKGERGWYIDLHTRPEEWHAPFPEEQVRYMAQDITVPCQIAELQAVLIEREGLEKAVKLDNRVVPAIALMELQGAPVNKQKLLNILEEKRKVEIERRKAVLELLQPAFLKQEAERYAKACAEYLSAKEAYEQTKKEEEARIVQSYREYTGSLSFTAFKRSEMTAWKKSNAAPKEPVQATELKLTAPEQVKAAFNALGLPVTSAKENEIAAFVDTHPFVKVYLDWKKVSSFILKNEEKRKPDGRPDKSNVLSHVTEAGRVHASFHIGGTVTGRFSCTEPNLQQIPKRDNEAPSDEDDIRSCFEAKEGHVLLCADLPNIELLIAADLSQDEMFLDAFAHEKNLHKEMAKTIFTIPEGVDIKTYTEKGYSVYAVAKNVNYGALYGMGKDTFAARYHVDVKFAEEVLSAFRSGHPKIVKLMNGYRNQAKSANCGTAFLSYNMHRYAGYVKTRSGRRRYYRDGDYTNSACNHPIQGLCADIMIRALGLLYEYLPEGAYTVMTIHDEVLVECPEAIAEQCKDIVNQCLVQACKEFRKIVKIPEDMGVIISKTWTKA